MEGMTNAELKILLETLAELVSKAGTVEEAAELLKAKAEKL